MCASGNKRRGWLAAACLLLATPLAAAKLDAHRVEDLAYGRALFEYFQERELDAITQLMVAAERARSREQVDEANLLLADLYYGYGLFEESRQMFARLLTAEVSDSVQNRIWFNLARLRFDQGHFDHALDLLARINDTLPAGVEAERKYLLTNLYLSQRQFDLAADLSNRIDSQSIWRLYARYNLGVSLIEDEDFERGRFLLDRIGQIEPRDAEQRALRDRANLSLGLKQLRLEQPEAALASLTRIRLEGPLSHEALLASGWAWHHLGKHDKAQTPWRLLLRRNALDAATQEAILAIPASHMEAGQDQLALRHFEIAARQFDAQLRLLDAAIDSIHSDGLIASLREHAILFDRASLQRLPPSSDVTPHLHLLLASTTFQREIRRYQQLLDIRNSLRYWGNNFPALELVLAERRKAFAAKLPKLQQSSSFATLADLRRQRDGFARRLAAIETNEDHAALASPQEQEHLERLARVAAGIDKLAGQRNTTYQQDMHRLLAGLMHYELATDYPARFWRAKKQLIALDRALDESRNRATDLRRIAERGEREFVAFERRIEGQEARIARLRGNVTALLARQERHINRLAIDAIRQQQRHVAQLRLNARFEMAKLYDRMADTQ